MITMDTHCQVCKAKLERSLEGGLCPACLLKEGFSDGATQKIKPDIDQLNAAIEDYEFVRFIGRGGMGAVYEGGAKSTGKTVALKVLLPELAKDPTFVERLKREALTMARLDHPNIVPVFHYRKQKGFVYLVLRYVEGSTLDRYLGSRELSEDDLAAVLLQIAKGLQYAHEEGIIHRDLKPQNVLVASAKGSNLPHVYLADFGLAKLFIDDGKGAELSLTGTHQVFGTARYMSPEQLENSSTIDYRSDYFSFAVMLYELLTRKRPLGRFENPEHVALTKYQGLATKLSPFILKSLNTNSDDRPEDLNDLIDLLTGAKSEQTVSTEIDKKRRRKKAGKNADARTEPFRNPGFGDLEGRVTPQHFGLQLMVSAVLLASTFMDWVIIEKITFSFGDNFGARTSQMAFSAWRGNFSLLGIKWPLWIIPLFVWLGTLHAFLGFQWPVRMRTVNFYNLAACALTVIVTLLAGTSSAIALGPGAIIMVVVCSILSIAMIGNIVKGIQRLSKNNQVPIKKKQKTKNKQKTKTNHRGKRTRKKR